MLIDAVTRGETMIELRKTRGRHCSFIQRYDHNVYGVGLCGGKHVRGIKRVYDGR